jgi:hypothetical protein
MLTKENKKVGVLVGVLAEISPGCRKTKKIVRI